MSNAPQERVFRGATYSPAPAYLSKKGETQIILGSISYALSTLGNFVQILVYRTQRGSHLNEVSRHRNVANRFAISAVDFFLWRQSAQHGVATLSLQRLTS